MDCNMDYLNGLAMISIDNKYLEKLNFDNLIEKFASKNTRRNNFLQDGSC